MLFNGTKLSKLKRDGNRYLYRGEWLPLNRPVSAGKRKKVLALKSIKGEKRVRLIYFRGGVKAHQLRESEKKDPWLPAYWQMRSRKDSSSREPYHSHEDSYHAPPPKARESRGVPLARQRRRESGSCRHRQERDAA